LTTIPTRREENRQDRLIQAQIAREDAAARSAIARDNEAAAAKQRTADLKAKADRKTAKLARKAASRKARAEWLGNHVAGILLAPVIAAGVTLSWSGMAAYGTAGYGIVGLALPVLSECGQWGFASAIEFSRRKKPAASVWHLRFGVLVATLMGMALNFNHGLQKGPGWAVTMALVSAFGITTHQLITAGPNWSRAERASARTARLMARIEAAAEEAAPVLIDEAGRPRKVFEAGIVKAERRWFRTVIVPDPEATARLAKPPPEAVTEQAPEGSAEAVAEGSAEPTLEPVAVIPRPVTVAVNKAGHGTLRLTFTPAAKLPFSGRIGGSGDPVTDPLPLTPGKPDGDPRSEPCAVPLVTPLGDPKSDPARDRDERPKRPRRQLSARPKRDRVTTLIEAGKSTDEIRRMTGASESTIKRRRSAIRGQSGTANVVPIEGRRHA